MDNLETQTEDKRDMLSSDSTFVSGWLDMIEAASKEEKDWRKEADEVIGIYRSEDDAARDDFNIVYSNVETTLPAIYNSTPVPDIRRRNGDRDKVGKTVSDILERSLAFSVDNYDFDLVMQSAVFDGLLPGRGLARVRYVPYMDESGEQVVYEETACEYVPWRSFRRGPGRIWDEIPFIAFEHFLTRESLERLNPEIGPKVKLDCSTIEREDEADPDKSDTQNRARVWEIWDKEKKEVVFIATGYAEKALLREKDPLQLPGFWPVPRPIQPIMTPGKLTPVAPYKAYRKLADELNEVSRRISKLVKQIRVRGGFYSEGQSLAQIMSADDGELVPLEGFGAFIDGGLDKAIMWWPIEPQVKALAQLYQQREIIKQTIYEVTGISDILRGQSERGETATAQNIKNQWGSQRVQRLQKEVQRFARDLFRMKAHIMAGRFGIDTLVQISGIKLYPAEMIESAKKQAQMAQQAQQPVPPEMKEIIDSPPREEVERLLRSEIERSYRIDIETDSTIRADMTRSQEQMNQFLQVSGAYMSAVGPAVQAGQMDPETAVSIYTAFSRTFKLGKQVEDALDRLSEKARQPQPKKPDPEQQKLEVEKQKIQMQQQAEGQKLQMDQQRAQTEMAMNREKMQTEMAMAQQKQAFDMELQREKMGQEYQLKMMLVNADIEIKRASAIQNAQLAQEQGDVKAELAMREADTKARLAEKQARQKAKAN